MSENEELTFEQAYEQLEKIVAKLEAGELSLDESMALFEEGIKLERLCGTKLDGAELRINELTSREGEVTGVKPFEAEES